MQIAVFAVMGVVALVVGLILLLVLPALGLWSLVIVGLGIILVASAAIIDRGRSVSRTLTSKRGKFGTSTTILVSVFSAIILLVNAIGVWKFQRFDFTGLSQFTLTQQTKDVLAKLDVPVEVTCFFAPSVPGIETELQDMYKSVRIYSLVLLAEYRNYTDKLIISIKDPEQEPELARKYGITNQYLYQTVVFETKQGMRRVPPWETFAEAENAFTSAILEVTGIKQKKVYFLTGHGEASPLDTSPIGYDSARQTLRDNLYLVEPLDLVATPKIPDDAAVLVIAGPRTAMNDNERQILANYLKNSGQVFFLTNPGAPDDIARLLAPWGVDV
ncbi:MAG: GldG family protein, partial [Dehalococcoidia bacterium]|nr:GldG family protein [Dehalococcoidia bacterium]